MDSALITSLLKLRLIVFMFLIIGCCESTSYSGRNAANATGPVALTHRNQNKNILRIGLVMPYTCGDKCSLNLLSNGETYAAAFKIAVDQINKNESLLPNHVIEFVFNDSKLEESIAIEAVYKQLNEMNVSAFVGLGWFCHSITALATAVRTPVISYVSNLKL